MQHTEGGKRKREMLYDRFFISDSTFAHDATEALL